MTLCIKSGKGISRGSKSTANARKLNVSLIHVKSMCSCLKSDRIPDLGICHLYKKKTGIIHACSVPL
ncbi:hypothetical protein T4B_2060 [Trichinella pseudospiralis]|uniref:Uncharacterized protein n=1 Tax=Trichinella pseudospiralis TaxID=6337 RepID=A0A0V1GN59_TRIPS|nr:hypothetical protein T4B_2060 [Trichinella pseudospiralis]